MDRNVAGDERPASVSHPDSGTDAQGSSRNGHACVRGNGLSTISRRELIAAGGGVALAGLAGCLGDSGPVETPDPVAIGTGVGCDQCGMIVADHPGPNGLLFYADNQPNGHDNPARFDSVRACLFPYLFEHERLDWEAVAVYVTDYSTVDYSLTEEDGEAYISSHTAASSFTDGRTAFYVIGSDVRGAMGADLIPFSVQGDATAFAADHGGDVLEFDDIEPAVLER